MQLSLLILPEEPGRGHGRTRHRRERVVVTIWLRCLSLCIRNAGGVHGSGKSEPLNLPAVEHLTVISRQAQS